LADKPLKLPGDGVQAHCLFLSHSGADTEAARELKRRILEAPEAREAGLAVWFDKDDLAPGGSWQEQIEAVITRRATAFAVLVGSKGIVNWVEREVRLGLARATGEDAIPFVPIVAEAGRPSIVSTLPPFAQQHQGVIDPLNDPVQFARLIDAILGRTANGPAHLIDEPFVGLRAMTEREADRFFGRSAEITELVEDLRRNRLVAIVADSGAGKSSLAMAGLAPAFRGGVLADPARRGPDDLIWHAVVMRPGGDPLEGLRRGVTEAAEHIGLSPDARDGLRRRLSLDEADHAAYALRCDLPAGSTETLLIVDQFDELLTETPEAARAPFIEFLLKLATMRSPGGFHVVLTVRVDYFNLCRPYGALYDQLKDNDRVLRLKRISDDGLEEAVSKPLRMAGFTDEEERKALIRQTRKDLSDRPGDLALAQMALWTVWRNRLAHGGSLLKAYVDVGGVSGALAQEAERIRTAKLSEAERSLLPALFVRLVRLGETGGVLRRLAAKDELDDARFALASKLASDEYGRLVLVGQASKAESAKVEVCHEALITQWPWLQNTLNSAAADLRVLERLMDRAAIWHAAPATERGKHLASGAERELLSELRQRRDAWLSKSERAFIAESDAAFAFDQTTKRRAVKRLRLLVGVLGTVALALVVVAAFAVSETHLARKQTRIAEAQKTRADRDFGAAKDAIRNLLSNVAEVLQRSAGMPVATIRRMLETVTTTITALAAAEPNDKDLQGARLVMLIDFADIYIRAGDIADAQAAAAEGLGLARDLAREEGSPEAQQNLAVALDEVGDVKMAADDLPGASDAYQQELAIARELGKNKEDAGSQHNLVVALEKIGDVKLKAGDLAGAHAAYEEALVIARELPKKMNGDQAQRDVASALDKVGDTELQAGDVAAARAAFEEELAIARQRANNKSDALAQLDLTIALGKIGDLKLQLGDLAGTRAAYEEELVILRELAKDKDDVDAQIRLTNVLENLGDLNVRTRDLAGARAAYQEELDWLQRLDRAQLLSGSEEARIGKLKAKLAELGQ
jgi:hypothetical protein